MDQDQDKDGNRKKLRKLIQCVTRKELLIDQVKAILDSGFDIHCKWPNISSTENFVHIPSGCNILHFTTQSDHADSYFDLLFKYGADVTRQSNIGLTPIHLAIQVDLKKNGSVDSSNNRMVDLLLSYQIESGNTANPSCYNGISHFHFACRYANVRAVKFFLDAGVPVNKCVNADPGLWSGYSPLLLAIQSENEDVIQLLLNYGANPNCVNSDGESPMHIIITYLISSRTFPKIDEKKASYYEHLLDLFLKPNENDLISPVDDFGLSYFHVYCLKKHATFANLELLLNLGIDINAPISFECRHLGGDTALHFAFHCGNKKTAKWLLKRGANLFAKNARGQTPLDVCLGTYLRQPLEIIDILKCQENFKSIKFENGSSLLDVIAAFDTSEKLMRLTRAININTAIPLDSPLWPGVTILQLSIMLSCFYDDVKLPIARPYGSVPAFVFCLDRRPNMMIQDADGKTAFHCFFYSKFSKDSARKVMDEHMDVSTNPTDKNTSVSHFHIACAARNIEIVRNFLKNGVNPNLPVKTKFKSDVSANDGTGFKYKIESGSTALHMSVAFASEKLARLLLEYNADPVIPDAEGFTWIHRAFVSRDFDLFKPLLFSHPNALKSNPTAPGGLSHFHIACASGNLKAAKALLPYVNDINERISPELLKYNIFLKEHDCIGTTSLHLAIKAGSEEIVDFLFDSGADMRAKQEDLYNPLCPFHKILSSSNKMPKVIKRVTEVLEEKGMWPDDAGLTRLHIACAVGNLEWIQALLEAGEDINSRMNPDSPIWPGCSPLDILVRQRIIDVKEGPKQSDEIEFLLNYILKNIECRGLADFDHVPVEEGFALFHTVCMAGNPKIVEEFLKFGVDVNISIECITYGHVGYFPLHFAVCYGKESVVEMLLKQKINVESQDLEGNTPLLLAAAKRPEFIDLFIKSNEFNIKTKNLFGETIIDLILDKNAMKKIKTVKQLFTLEMDFVTKLKLVTKLVERIPGNDLKSLFESKPCNNEVDIKGQNFIHHLVLSSGEVKSKEFALKIEALANIGCELDHQDIEGRTPLHCAVLAEDLEKVTALLSIGANINAVDASGKTPVTSAPNRLIDVFKRHVSKLKTVDLYLHPLNETFIRENAVNFQECLISGSIGSMFITDTICVRDFLCEKMVREFFKLSLDDQSSILNFMEMIYSQSKLLPKKISSDWIPIFKFQQRRIEKRQKLLQLTIASLKRLHDNEISEDSLESILINMSNEECENLILATDSN